MFITLPPLQQEGRHISRLQSTANRENQRMLIPVSTTGLGMDKLSLRESWNYSTTEIRRTAIVVYVTKVRHVWLWQIYICTLDKPALACFLTIIPCLALRDHLELNTLSETVLREWTVDTGG